MSGSLKSLTGMLASFVLIFALAPVTSAQKRNDGSIATSAASRRDRILAREADLTSRELNLRLLRDQARKRQPTERDRKLALTQIFDDFEHIQLISREMTREGAAARPPYKLISDKAKEMNTRAKRLETNLAIPPFDEGFVPIKSVAANDEEMRAFVFKLSQSVKSFVSNPLFQNPKVTDVQQFAAVRRNLADIIELSLVIKKSAQKLKR